MKAFRLLKQFILPYFKFLFLNSFSPFEDRKGVGFSNNGLRVNQKEL
jgi:hypothetical protein